MFLGSPASLWVDLDCKFDSKTCVSTFYWHVTGEQIGALVFGRDELHSALIGLMHPGTTQQFCQTSFKAAETGRYQRPHRHPDGEGTANGTLYTCEVKASL